MSKHLNHETRHDFVLLFDVRDGNPNGDPDAGNLPRVDPETMQGLVTDVALKRKVRDYVDAVTGDEERNKIYVQHHSYLVNQRERPFKEMKLKDSDTSKISETQAWMCANFFDVRMFGAVMSMKERNCGQVRGPMQLTFARSVSPIVPLDISITRVALENPKEKPKEGESEVAAPTHGTMGRKALLPYGLYMGYGFYAPHLAERTGADSADLSLFWNALVNMWDLDRSASRGMMACRGLYVFTHDHRLGSAPAHTLFDRIGAKLIDEGKAPRAFTDYAVTVDAADLPEGITLTKVC